MQGPAGCLYLSGGIPYAPVRQRPSSGRTCSFRGTPWNISAIDEAHSVASQPAPVSTGRGEALSRRTALLGLATATVLCPQFVPAANASEQQQSTRGALLTSSEAYAALDYSLPGPLTAALLPKLEHTCTRCFPACLGNRCMLSLDVVYPKGGKIHGKTMYKYLLHS